MGFRQKLKAIFSIHYALSTYPFRLMRILKHIVPYNYNIGIGIRRLMVIFEWFFSIFLLLGDLLFLPEILCAFYILFNNNVKGLSPKEKEIVKELFGDKLSIPIFTNDCASFLTKNGRYAFVSFYMINSCGISDKTFAHELIHIYQFSKFGTPYTIRSLIAQNSKDGYDYHGLQGLKNLYDNDIPGSSLNYEQQGDVLADYYQFLKCKPTITDTSLKSKEMLYTYACQEWLS
jgi:hypothetical protein